MRTQLLAVAICATGCQNVLPGEMYNVLLDPTFTPAQVEATLTAVKDLQAKLPTLAISVAIAPCSGIHPATLCLHPTDPPIASKTVLGWTEHWNHMGYTWRPDGGETWIAFDRIAPLLAEYPLGNTTVIQHELLHGMGLEHHPGHVLMNIDMNNDATSLTCDDIAQWYYVRYQTPPTCTDN